MCKKRGYLQEIHFQKKRRRQRKLFFIFAIILIFLSAAVYSFFYSNLFSISNFKVADYASLDNSAVDNTITSYLNKEFLFGLISRKDNFLLLSKKDLTGQIEANFPEIKKAQIDLNIFKNNFDISLEKREPAGIWCYTINSTCFYFDSNGFLFKQAESGSNIDLLAVVDENKNALELKQALRDKELFLKIIEADKIFKTLDFLNYSNFYIPENSFNDFWLKTKEGWNIYFDKSINLEDQITALKELLAKKITSEKRAILSYIDLRIQGRIYYK